MTERDVEFRSGDLRLAGTLTLPDSADRSPAVLMIAGSGQVDRDENAKKIRVDSLRQLAAHLASHGVASLRYDKRGVGASEGDYWETGFADNFVDAGAALSCLEEQDDVDAGHVFVLGHSEGASIAVRLAASRPDLAGAILLAGSGRSGEECLGWQAEKVVQGMHGFNKWLIDCMHVDIHKSQSKAFDKIRSSEKNSCRVQLVKKINAKWLREFLDYDPAEDLSRIRIPVLAITGSKDIQVNPDDLEIVAGLVRGGFESHVVPDVTHMLRADPGEPTLATYKWQVTRPVDARVLNLVTDWLARHDS